MPKHLERTHRAPRPARTLPARAGVACLLAVLGGAPGAWIAGCHSAPRPVSYARVYPVRPDRAETLNIQVFRSAKHIELTNTTADAFGPSTLWLNARFSRPLSTLGVGETIRLPLREFKDEFSESFRGGGFFATEEPDRLVLAELETPGDEGTSRFLRLVVVGGEDE